MTDKEFCELHTQFYGEKIDNIKQLTLITFNGEELKEFIDFCIEQSKLSQHDVIKNEVVVCCENCANNHSDFEHICSCCTKFDLFRQTVL